jgi:hypothetical protein
MMLEDTELRTRLESLAHRTAPPPRDAGELAATVAARVHDRRRRRSALAVAAAAAAVLVWVSVPLVGSSEDRGTEPTRPLPSPVEVYGEPTRGALAVDSAFVDGVRRLPWAAGSTDRTPAPRVEDRHVVWASDLGNVRVALVAGPDPTAGPGADALAVAWFTGSSDAGADAMSVAAVRYGVDPARPAAFVDVPTGVVVVVAAPADKVELSPRPEVDGDGTVRRPFRLAPTVQGVATLVEHYPVVADDAAPERVAPLRYRILRDGERLTGTIDVDLGPDAPAAPDLTADRLREAPAAHPGDAAARVEMEQLLARTGLSPDQVSFTVLWAGDLPRPGPGSARLTLLAARLPSGAQYVGAALGSEAGSRSCGSEVRPAGTLDRAVAVRCSAGARDSLVVVAPARLVTATALDGDGRAVDTYPLTDGTAVVPWDARVAEVLIRDADGRVVQKTAPLEAAQLD